MNKRAIFFITAIVFVLTGMYTTASDSGPWLRRYALFIGANNGGKERVPLLYAATDTNAMASVFFEIGGLNPEDTIITIDPSRRELERQFQRIKELISQKKQESQRAEFFLYYSGHSDEQGLLINGDLFPYRKLRNEMKGLNADISVAILDSCASGAFIRIKGGTRVAPFLMDESSSMKGQVYLSSSSEDEASQESDEIGASFFTHSLISALRGAADFSGDGQITIHEAYQYARSETIARTENTIAGTQHPAWHIELTGTGDLVLTDVRELNAGIVLTKDLEGQIFIRDGADKLVVEVRKSVGIPITLALPEGMYTITARTEEQNMESIVTLYNGSLVAVTIGDFIEMPRIAGRLRGDGDPETEKAEEEGLGEQIEELVRSYIGSQNIQTQTEVPFIPASLSFTPGLTFPQRLGRSNVGLSFNVLVGVTYGIRGAEFGSIMNITRDQVYGAQFAGVGNIVEHKVTGYQGAGVFNINGGELRGVQSAGVFNISKGDSVGMQAGGVFNINAGHFEGAQFGGVFNINTGLRGFQAAGVFNIVDNDVEGYQAAGIFNIAENKIVGVQTAGVFNFAGDMDGAQIGTVNVSDTIKGPQIGVVNVGGNVSGVQVGVINIADTMKGFPLGLINISGNGLVGLSVVGDADGLYNLDFQSGHVLYTRLSVGTNFATIQTEPVLNTAAGLGLHFQAGWFFIEGDASASTTFKVFGDPDTGYWGALPYPELRLKGGVLLFDRVGIYGGVKAALHVDGMDYNQFAHTGASYSFDFADRTWTMFHKIIWGAMFKF